MASASAAAVVGWAAVVETAAGAFGCGLLPVFAAAVATVTFAVSSGRAARAAARSGRLPVGAGSRFMSDCLLLRRLPFARGIGGLWGLE